MWRVFRVVDTKELKPVGVKTTGAFNRSIRRLGVLNPVVLAEVVDTDGVITLTIIDGNRRIRAAQAARLPKVPAVVLKATTAQDRARLTLMCNHMRSANFHTESAAVLTLATDEDSAAQAASAIGLGPARVQQLYRKIATMPEPVRRAMYEHRLPVTAATWVGSWPEGLQQEVVELLGRRRYVNTSMMKDLREWYAERHPEEFGAAEPAKEDVPFDEWSGTTLRVVEIPAPPVVPETDWNHGEARLASVDGGMDSVAFREPFSFPGTAPQAARSGEQLRAGIPASSIPTNEASSREPGELASMWPPQDRRPVAPAAPAEPATPELPPQVSPVSVPAPAAPSEDTQQMSSPRPTPIAVMDAPAPPPVAIDNRAERRVAFVVRLDSALRELAREGHAIGIDRSVWVDRTMRAWDGIGG